MKQKTLLLLAVLSLTACASMTLMIHPVTGERKECRSTIIPHFHPIAQMERSNCVDEYRSVGFIQASELTPEQRQNITPRSSAGTIKIEK